MFRSRFLWKLFLAHALLLTAALVVYEESTFQAAEESVSDEALARLRIATVLVEERQVLPTNGVLETGTPLEPFLAQFLRERSIRLTYVGADGIARIDSSGSVNQDLSGRTEVDAALRGETILRETRSARSGEEAFLLGRPVFGTGGAVLGAFRAEIDRSALKHWSPTPREVFWPVYLGALALLFGIVWLVIRRLERDSRRMVRAVRIMAKGEFGELRPVHAQEPFEELVSALEELSQEGRNRVETIATDRNRVVAILGAMVEGVVAVDATERVVRMNAAAARMLGTQSGGAKGRPIWEVTRIREVPEILASALRTAEPQTGEMRVVTPPRDRWIELRASPLARVGGGVAGAVLVLHDVSELRRLEAMRRDFVGNVSHELKTPITAIRGRVETMLDDAEMEGETRTRFLTSIRDQSVRLSALVTDLLTLSRMESETMVGDFTLLDLRQPVRDSVAALAQPAESKGVELHVDLPERPIQVNGEPESLRLIVNNLIDNGIKYTTTGGRIWVRLRTDSTHAILEVADDGIGIEQKHLDRIFQRFYRVDKARSREVGGTGLGLSIVKHVCLQHDADIDVESTAGSGTTFRVRIPLA